VLDLPILAGGPRTGVSSRGCAGTSRDNEGL
jgi:hypothetical protein